MDSQQKSFSLVLGQTESERSSPKGEDSNEPTSMEIGESKDNSNYLPELLAERDHLDASFAHAMRLLNKEIEQSEKGDTDTIAGEKRRKNTIMAADRVLDIIDGRQFRYHVKIAIPFKQHPKVNFVGKLIGPGGTTLKGIQEETGCRISILGKGSMRDKTKEEEMRTSGDPKYNHLNQELHVSIDVLGSAPESYTRLGHAIGEVKKIMLLDGNYENIDAGFAASGGYYNGDGSVVDGGIRGGGGGRGHRGMRRGRGAGRGAGVPLIGGVPRGALTPRGGARGRGRGYLPGARGGRGGLPYQQAGRGGNPPPPPGTVPPGGNDLYGGSAYDSYDNSTYDETGGYGEMDVGSGGGYDYNSSGQPSHEVYDYSYGSGDYSDSAWNSSYNQKYGASTAGNQGNSRGWGGVRGVTGGRGNVQQAARGRGQPHRPHPYARSFE